MSGWYGPYGLQPAASPFVRDLLAALALPIDPGYVDDGMMRSFHYGYLSEFDPDARETFSIDDPASRAHHLALTVGPPGWIAAAHDAIREQLPPPKPQFRWSVDPPLPDLSRQILAVADIRIRQANADAVAEGFGVPRLILPETQQAIDDGWLVARLPDEERDFITDALGRMYTPGSAFRRGLGLDADPPKSVFANTWDAVAVVPMSQVLGGPWITLDGGSLDFGIIRDRPWCWWERPHWAWRLAWKIRNVFTDHWPDP